MKPEELAERRHQTLSSQVGGLGMRLHFVVCIRVHVHPRYKNDAQWMVNQHMKLKCSLLCSLLCRHCNHTFYKSRKVDNVRIMLQ